MKITLSQLLEFEFGLWESIDGNIIEYVLNIVEGRT